MQAEGFKVRLGELREIDSTMNILISLNAACGESTALKDRGLAYGVLRTKNTLFDPWYRIQNHLFFVAHRNIYIHCSSSDYFDDLALPLQLPLSAASFLAFLVEGYAMAELSALRFPPLRVTGRSNWGPMSGGFEGCWGFLTLFSVADWGTFELEATWEPFVSPQ